MSKEIQDGSPQHDRSRDVIIEREPDAVNPDEAAERKRKIDEFLRLRNQRWKLCADGEGDQRTRSLEELEFNSGKHWDDGDRDVRDNAEHITLEVNRTPQYLNQVANDQRMTRPVILVRPTGNGADEETAKIKQGIVRSNERKSKAEEIRDDAFYAVLEKGWSYYRVIVEFESDRSFRRVIRTRRVLNDFSVYCDPSAAEYNRTDSNFWFVTEDVPEETFKLEHKDSELTSLTSYESIGDTLKDWVGKGTIRIAEYIYKEQTKEKLYALADDPDGDGLFDDEIQKDTDGTMIGVAKSETGEALWRWSIRTRWFWSKVSATEILDGNDDKTAGREVVPGSKYSGIIPVFGRRIYVNGKYMHCGMVRDAIEPCRAADYWLSAITEMVAAGPKAPWIVAYEAIAQYREMWDGSNIENYAALYYDAFDADGNPLPAPIRNFGEPPIQAMTFILKFADEDIKRVMGIFNAGLGAPGPETSGVAIDSRKHESDVANFNYIDNLKRAINLEGDVQLDYMRRVLTKKQVVEIIRPDGDSEMVTINALFNDKSGKDVQYQMNQGNYDVDVEVGTGFNTKRQEAAHNILEYIKIDQQAAPFVGDILMRNLDTPDKKELEQRLHIRAMQVGVPAEDDSGKDVPAGIKAQYQQMTQQNEQLTEALHHATDALESKKEDREHELQLKAMDIDGREREAKINAGVKLVDIASKEDIESLRALMTHLMKSLEASPMESPSGPDFERNLVTSGSK